MQLVIGDKKRMKREDTTGQEGEGKLIERRMKEGQ